ncbi:MAG: prepilin-type N-terminal cleavage/methylation domain-containing protein [Acidobacteriota bacterium]
MKSIIGKSKHTLRQRGFTLLELIMVMTIMVILVAVSVGAYQKIQLKAKETVLKETLRSIRRAIDQYAADKEQLPQSVEDLATAGYLREVPIDPMTGEADWTIETGEDTVSREGGEGMVDVRSSAEGTGTDGKAYREY